MTEGDPGRKGREGEGEDARQSPSVIGVSVLDGVRGAHTSRLGFTCPPPCRAPTAPPIPLTSSQFAGKEIKRFAIKELIATTREGQQFVC